MHVDVSTEIVVRRPLSAGPIARTSPRSRGYWSGMRHRASLEATADEVCVGVLAGYSLSRKRFVPTVRSGKQWRTAKGKKAIAVVFGSEVASHSRSIRKR